MDGPAGSASGSRAGGLPPSPGQRKRPASGLEEVATQPTPSKARRTSTSRQGRPLQLVQLNMEERRVEVCEEALAELEDRLRRLGARKIAIVSVMGAFRTGKSFLLDLFLRYLRHEEGGAPGLGASEEPAAAPLRHDGGREAPLPTWVTAFGNTIEGAACSEGGFRFRGGMDACTEGIWVWSEPFRRTINGEPVAVVLMDTQGAWDNNMTKEQSATIFGLTAVLSSKQIYNINMQIQEDKVENLAYFMRFAQTALRQAASELSTAEGALAREDLERPFQALDFLVRDWRHFREEWSLEQCKEQMQEHLSKHVDPAKVRENDTAKALQSMFRRIGCFCLPHPGFAIERETWTGGIHDISPDFLHFADAYVREVFTNLDTKRILGSEMSTVTFPLVLRSFVRAFRDAAPAAMSFTQAMTSSTVLLAKEQAMKTYQRLMDEAFLQNPRGVDLEAFEAVHQHSLLQVRSDFWHAAIFGSEGTREEAWTAVQLNLHALRQPYAEENARRLDAGLNSLAPFILVGLILFLLDRSTDWTCDWWSQTCVNFSRVMMAGYVAVGAYAGVQGFMINRRRPLSTSVVVELQKEMLRLGIVVYSMAVAMKLGDLANLSRPRDTAAVAGAEAATDEKKER
eukprot:CAMPEP_0171283552 /NCGR_PEP_ID=MMETSP0790-20130122/67493_1 /TAXON_ID=2925 /ORGANISM="Alexandrium catenella, Strain OF101" /LENGTH=626 /DNA_ID=CAMNT_0011752843 /DNA_START=12 /DNA_END=1893 /DNA_ORIENTATION=+